MAKKPIQESYPSTNSVRVADSATASTGSRGPRTREALSRICIPVPRSERTLTALKRSPERLFPKMKEILQKSEDTADESEATPRYTKHRDVTLPPMTGATKTEEDDVTAPERDDEGQFGAEQVFRMIRQLSSNLPTHLRATARAQIRAMTNADSIDQRNNALKRACVGLLYRERTLGDRRWAKLQMALSPRNVATNDVTWKRKSGNTWCLFRNEAEF